MNSVLYLGPRKGTSLQRAEALKRIGCEVDHISIYGELPKYWSTWQFHGGGLGLDWLAARAIRKTVPMKSYDVILVDNGDVIGPAAMREIRKRGNRVVNYNADNPYLDPSPEKYRWCIMRKMIKNYHISISIRRDGQEALMRKAGVKHPMLIWQTADEIVHKRPKRIDSKYLSDVSFVGTWMPGRGEFVRKLIESGVSIKVYGPRWNKSKNYEAIKNHVRIEHLDGVDYASALAGAKIGIVMLNHRNHDWHTKRSIEIPALGVAMCAPDTPYHRELYRDGEEAVFYQDSADCAAQCLRLLANNKERERIALQGHQRCLENETWNEKLMAAVLERAMTL